MKYLTKIKLGVLLLVVVGTLLGCTQESPIIDTTTADPITSITDLNTDKVSLIALGNSDVPVGRYAQEALTSLGMWDEIQDKISYASNVKEVLSQVALGSVTCGIVYATDAATSDDTMIVEYIDNSLLATPVLYPAALLTNSTNPESAATFLAYLLNESSIATFEANGFTVIADATAQSTFPAADTLEPCTLTIFAAASLLESVTAISEAFMVDYAGIEIIASYDSSGTLATQIEYGADVDIFISASTSEVDDLIDLDYIEEEQVLDLLANELVLITQNGGDSN